ncbi:unnamed protein product [Heterosigma akashiwo]
MAQGVIITTKVQRDRGDREVTAPTRPCRVARLGARRYRVVLQEGRNRRSGRWRRPPATGWSCCIGAPTPAYAWAILQRGIGSH